MMSPATIRDLAAKAARKAAKEKRTPFVPFDEREIKSWPPFPFPNLGDHRPPGWELVDHFMVDATGLGSEGEPALTVAGLKKRLLAELAAPETFGYGIIEEGQFQIVMGKFKRTGPMIQRVPHTPLPQRVLADSPVVTLRQKQILTCPFAIIVPAHWRPDGTCRCNDPEHRMMMVQEWGYRKSDFVKAGVIPAKRGKP